MSETILLNPSRRWSVHTRMIQREKVIFIGRVLPGRVAVSCVLRLLATLGLLIIVLSSNVSLAEVSIELDEAALRTESQTLLSEVDELEQQSKKLNEAFSGVEEGMDYILFADLAFMLDENTRKKIDRLIEIEQSLKSLGITSDPLHDGIRTSIVKQFSLIKRQVKGLSVVSAAMEKKEQAEQGDTPVTLMLSINRANKQLDDLITAWQKNVAHAARLKMPQHDAETEQLNQLLLKIAIGYVAHIRFELDSIEQLKAQSKRVPESQKKMIDQQLHDIEFRKNTMAERLETVVGVMNRQGLETTQFGKVLVVATGQILNKNVNTEAVIGVVQQIVNSGMKWWNENIGVILFKVVSSILILLAFRLLAALLSRLMDRATSSTNVDASQLLKNFLSSITSRLVMLIGIIVALSQLGIELGPLLAGMGAIGFVVGFALKDTLSNFSSGVMILIYRPFDVGDVVEIADVMGKIRDMQLVTTTVLTFDNQLLVIPNTNIWGSTIRNITSQANRRIDLSVHIGHDVDLDRAEKIFQEMINSDERVLDDPPTVIRVHKIHPDSIELIIRPWVRTAEYWPVYWDLTKAIKQRLDLEKIAIPHPQHDIYLHQTACLNES